MFGAWFLFLSVGENSVRLHYKGSSPCEGADGKPGSPDGEQGFCRAGWTSLLLSHGDLSPVRSPRREGKAPGAATVSEMGRLWRHRRKEESLDVSQGDRKGEGISEKPCSSRKSIRRSGEETTQPSRCSLGCQWSPGVVALTPKVVLIFVLFLQPGSLTVST